MRKHNLNYVVIGLFVAAMLASVVVAMTMISGKTDASETYSIVFDNVADVKFGAQVRFEGYPIGQVEDIEPFSDQGRMHFRITVAITEGWRIPADSVARIGKSSFLGARTVDIESGKSQSVLEPGGQLASAPSTDIFSAITRVADEISDVNQELVRPLLVELGSFSRRLNGSMAAVQQILSPANVDTINTMLVNFGSMSGRLNEASFRIRALAARVDALVAENSANITGGVEDFRYILKSVAQNIDTINHNLDGAARNLNEFSRQIRSNPGLLLGGTSRKEVRGGDGQGQVQNQGQAGIPLQSGEAR